MYKNSLYWVVLGTLLFVVACSHTVNESEQAEAQDEVWYMVLEPIRLRRVLIIAQLNSSRSLKSFRYRFPLLKYPKKWTGPDQLSKHLNEAGYKSQIINKNMVVSSPPDYIASA